MAKVYLFSAASLNCPRLECVTMSDGNGGGGYGNVKLHISQQIAFR